MSQRPATLADELWRLLATLSCSVQPIPDVHAPSFKGAAVIAVPEGVRVRLTDGTTFLLRVERESNAHSRP